MDGQSANILFAFGFSSPWMLVWLVAGVIPWVLHRLIRQRSQETPWAATRFLIAALSNIRRRIRLENITLLIIRTLLIVLLVTALARPRLSNPASDVSSSSDVVHHVLVIDGSYSMNYREDGVTRFELARRMARQQVESSQSDDAFTLLLMARTCEPVVAAPSFDRADVLRRIDRLEPVDTRADIPSACAGVESVLKSANELFPHIGRHEVSFITDLGRTGWDPSVTPGLSVAGLRADLGRLTRRASVRVLDVGSEDRSNVAITRVGIVPRTVMPSVDFRIEAELHNFADQVLTDYPVELWIDGQRGDLSSVAIPANGSNVAWFRHRFVDSDYHTVEIRTPADSLVTDNRRYHAMNVRREFRVLLVGSSTSTGGVNAPVPARSSCEYLADAIRPVASSDRPRLTPDRFGSPLIDASRSPLGRRVDVTQIDDYRLTDTDLKPYDCVMLCDVARLVGSEPQQLRDFVRQGGGLIVWLGPTVDARSYNEQLAATEQSIPASSSRSAITPLLPARLGPVESFDAEPYGVDPIEYRHPILRAFRTDQRSGLLTTPVDRYYSIETSDRDTATFDTVMRLPDGAPLIVERSYGEGRVVMVTTSPDLRWSPMPLWPSFVPLVHEMTAWAAGGRNESLNVRAGSPLIIRPNGMTPIDTMSADFVPAGFGPAGLRPVIERPDGQTDSLGIVRFDADRASTSDGAVYSHATYRFNDTMIAGFYRVRFDAKSVDEVSEPDELSSELSDSSIYAVNIDTFESDPGKIRPEQLNAMLGRTVPIAWVKSADTVFGDDRGASTGMTGPAMTGTTPANDSVQRVWSRTLLAIALLLLVLDIVLARRFGHYQA